MKFNFKFQRINQLALVLMLVIMLLITANNQNQGQEAIDLQIEIRDKHSILLNVTNDLHQSTQNLHGLILKYRSQQENDLEELIPILNDFRALIDNSYVSGELKKKTKNNLYVHIDKILNLVHMHIEEDSEYNSGEINEKLNTLLVNELNQLMNTLHIISSPKSSSLKRSGIWLLQNVLDSIIEYKNNTRVDKSEIELVLSNATLHYTNFKKVIEKKSKHSSQYDDIMQNDYMLDGVFLEYSKSFKYYVSAVPSLLYLDEDNEVTQDDIDNLYSTLDSKWYDLQYQIKKLRSIITSNLNFEINKTIDFLKSSQLISLIATIAGVLLVGFFMLILNNILSKRLTVLRKGADNFSKGNLGEKIRLDTNDEFSDLANNFNDMSEKIASREKQLIEINDSLEQRIKVRTNELELSRDEAESANMAKSNFLSTMSHEIRTPMNGVIGMLELLQRTNLESDQSRFVTTANESANNLLDIINEILDFSKIEAGHLNLEITSFNLIKLVENSIALLSEAARKNHTELICAIDTELPVYVHGDPTRLRQIIINLVSNAIKFTKNGEVILRCTNNMKSAGKVHFEIIDTGIGISEDVQAQLFHVFTQADGSITRQYGGTGLGLAISQRLCQLMGSHIKIDSRPGQGSRFYFDLDLQPDDLQLDDMPGTGSNIDCLKGSRILVVDDNQTNLDVISGYLSHWGVEYDIALNADDALSLCHVAQKNNKIYNLGLFDYHMPDKDGCQLADELIKEPGLSNFPIVLLSSTSMLNSEAKTLGFTDSITKPVHLTALYETLCRINDSSFSESPTTDNESHSKYFSGRVLLVDDHEINRMMAETFLIKMGVTVVHAENGKQAVDLWQAEHFDLIFMDVQMPIMDGYQSTRKIRQLESIGNQQRTPIIAMTANVLSDDKKASEQAGMDDHLPKPFTWKHMESTLEKWLPLSNNPVALAQTQADKRIDTPVSASILDDLRIKELIQNLGDNFPKMVALVSVSVNKSMDIMTQAIQNKDMNMLAREAHKLKGVAGSMSGVETMDICQQLENSANDNDFELSIKHFESLPQAFERFEVALSKLI